MSAAGSWCQCAPLVHVPVHAPAAESVSPHRRTAQVLLQGGRKLAYDEPNPFRAEGSSEELAAVAYRCGRLPPGKLQSVITSLPVAAAGAACCAL